VCPMNRPAFATKEQSVQAPFCFQRIAFAVCVQYVAFQQLYIKLVGGYARGHWTISDDDPAITYSDDMYSLRLRFAFYF
jgi:hypothetical protein